MSETGHVFRLAVTWSVAWFYVAILISLAAVGLLIRNEIAVAAEPATQPLTEQTQ